MNNGDLSRSAKRFVRYFWDPLPQNDSTEPIWCLGRQYDSQPVSATSTTPEDAVIEVANTSPSVAASNTQQEKNGSTEGFEKIERDESTDKDEALERGWPSAFMEDVESKIWMTYRSNFSPISKSADPKAASAMSWSTRLKQLTNQEGFTSDTGFGCMIRSGQSLLANTLAILDFGRDWRKGHKSDAERHLLSLFADDPSAPYSIHRFVEHGAAACGKHPGEWFGPSATARCIQALTSVRPLPNLRVYVRPDDSDVYEDTFLNTARDDDGTFKPTLILLGTRLGIDRITPVYHAGLKRALEMPQSIGIAGGRPSSSHYFVGTQGQTFFYLDPHTTRPQLPLNPSPEDIATCHTRRLRRIDVTEMDPSMLLGFLIDSEAEWREWRAAISEPGTMGPDGKKGKPIVHVHDHEPEYTGQAGQGERREAVDEVQSCDESDDEAAVL